LAVQILAVADAEFQQKLVAFKAAQQQKVREKDASLS
jgi:phosphoribosylcarboxyaminoimidazole (NCAIR) mutase